MNPILLTGALAATTAVLSVAPRLLEWASASPALPVALGFLLAGLAVVARGLRSPAARPLALVASFILGALAAWDLVGPWTPDPGTPGGIWMGLAGLASGSLGFASRAGRVMGTSAGIALAATGAATFAARLADGACGLAAAACGATTIVALSSVALGVGVTIAHLGDVVFTGFCGRFLAPFIGKGRAAVAARTVSFVTLPVLVAAALGVREAMVAFGHSGTAATGFALVAAAGLGTISIRPLLIALDHVEGERARVAGDAAAARALNVAAEGHAYAGSWDWDLESGRQEWSEGFRKLLGIEPGSPASLELFRVTTHPDDRRPIDPTIAANLRDGDAWSYRTRIVTHTGEVRSIESHGVALTVNGRKRLVGFSREAPSSAQEAHVPTAPMPEAPTAADAAPDSADRQVREALQSMILMAEARGRSGVGVRAKRGQVDDVMAMVDAVAEISGIASRQGGAVAEDIRIGNILRTVAASFEARAREAEVELRVVAPDAACRTDPALLERLLSSLLADAIGGAPHGGRVLIGCRASSAGRLVIVVARHAIAHGSWAKPLPPGPGLAVALRIADLMGHPLTLRSGNLHVVSVTLPPPLDIETLPARGSLFEDLVEGRGDERALTVVVIEDEPLVRDGIRLALEGWGHTVVVGEDFEAAAKGLAAIDWPPDVVLSDYHLAGGMSGIDAVGQLRNKLGWKVPGILLTGDVSLADLDGSRRAGMAVLIKPIRVADLREALLVALADTDWL